MGRNTNCRPRDLSSIFRHKPLLYIKRMLSRGDEAIPAEIEKRKPILNLTTHFLYPMVDVVNIEDRLLSEDVFSQYSHQELIKMIMKLPDGCRVIFNMYAIEGYKHHEIAERLKISEGTSKSQYSRARKLLTKLLDSKGHTKYG